MCSLCLTWCLSFCTDDPPPGSRLQGRSTQKSTIPSNYSSPLSTFLWQSLSSKVSLQTSWFNSASWCNKKKNKTKKVGKHIFTPRTITGHCASRTSESYLLRHVSGSVLPTSWDFGGYSCIFKWLSYKIINYFFSDCLLFPRHAYTYVFPLSLFLGRGCHSRLIRTGDLAVFYRCPSCHNTLHFIQIYPFR